MLTKKILLLQLQEIEEKQSESHCWKGSLMTEHQPLLTMASSSSKSRRLCSPLLAHHCSHSHRQVSAGTACAGLAEHRNVPGGYEGEAFCAEHA